MSQYGFAFLRDIDRRLAVEGAGSAPVDIALTERGYLYLAAPNAVDAMRAVHAIQRAEGADVELLEPDAMTDRFPCCRPTGWRWARSGAAVRAGSTATG